MFAQLSDSEDPQLVSITRLQDRSGLGNMIRKLRDGFRRGEGDMTRFWMPDSNSKECHDCGYKFSTIRRKHHCRICGQIFCNRCCSKKIDGDQIGYQHGTRVRCCNYCHKMVSGYLRNKRPDSESNELAHDLEVSAIRTTNRVPETFRDLFNLTAPPTIATSELGGGFRSPRKSVDESSLLDAATGGRSTPLYTPFKRKHSLSMRAESYNRTSTLDTITFEQLPGVANTSNVNTVFGQKEDSTDGLEDDSQEPAWVKEIEQKENLFDLIGSDFDFGESNTDTIRSNDTSLQTISSSSESKDVNNIRCNLKSTLVLNEELEDSCFIDSTQLAAVAIHTKTIQSSQTEGLDQKSLLITEREKPLDKTKLDYNQEFSKPMQQTYERMYEKLGTQMLQAEQLSLDWFVCLRDICRQVARSVQPVADMNEQMDIRRNIKIKTIVGGTRDDCVIHNGIVFRKNVAHRKMKIELNRPKILLLSCPLMYQQRMQQKYITFEQLFMQESNYLENLVEKISSYGPNLVIVDKTAALSAQELLLKKKITLVCNVKNSILRKIARLTGAEVIASLDAQIGCPTLGHCERFFLHTYNQTKTLMFLDGCSPALGCSVLLRGSTYKNELKKLKKICYFLIYCDYNWQLEQSLLFECLAYIQPSTFDCFNRLYSTSTLSTEHSQSTLELPASQNDHGFNDNVTQMTNNHVAWHQTTNATLDPLYVLNSNDRDLTLASPLPFNLSNAEKDDSSHLSLHRMRTFIDNLVLNTSPFLKYPKPYLLSEEGDASAERSYFDLSQLYQVSRYRQFEDTNRITLRVDESVMNRQQEKDQELEQHSSSKLHEFLQSDLKRGSACEQTQEMLAMFRATGGAISILADLAPNGQRIRKKKGDLNDSSYESGQKLNASNDSIFPFDPFDARFHQLLPVLFSSFTHNQSATPYCVGPSIMLMEFYVERDMTLGAYLRRFCFNATRACMCRSPAVDHVSRFANAYGQVHVRLVRLESNIVTPLPDQIIGWSWCSVCRVSTANHVWSERALSISFAKFLQLKIFGDAYVCWKDDADSVTNASCPAAHSLFHDHYQYFAYQDLLAVFIYHPVRLRSIRIPVTQLELEIPSPRMESLNCELQRMHRCGYETMSAIVEHLVTYQSEAKPMHQAQSSLLEQYASVEQSQRHELKNKIEQIQEQLGRPMLSSTQRIAVSDQIKLLSQLIATLAYEWNERFQDFEAQRKRDDKMFSRKPFLQSSGTTLTHDLSAFTMSSQFIRQISEPPLPIQSEPKQSELLIRRSSSKSFRASVENDEYGHVMKVELSSAPEVDALDQYAEPSTSIDQSSNTGASDSPGLLSQLTEETIEKNGLLQKCRSRPNSFCDSNQGKCDLVDLEAMIRPSSKPLFDPVNASTPMLTATSNSINSQPVAATIRKEPTTASLNTRQAVKSLFNLLSTSANSVIPNPFPLEQHLLLPMRERVPIIVEDNDIGSIIAYSLTSGEYEKRLAEIQHSQNFGVKTHSSIEEPGATNLESATKGVSEHINLQFSDSNTTYYCCVYYAEVFRKLRQQVLRIQANDEYHQEVKSVSLKANRANRLKEEISKSSYSSEISLSQLSIQANNSGEFIMGNETFESSRPTVASTTNNAPISISSSADVEEAYIRSLAETMAWNAKGGKSKASFCKTSNDRFVIKGVLKADLHQFTKMAGAYFQYTQSAVKEHRPTLLAKIVGVYEVGCKNSSTGIAYKKHLIVMENVFYRRKISQKFDLKGSEKNRLANKKLADDVLLDENLTKMIRDQPLYVRAHSKLLLQAAIDSDSWFLCRLNVIDYSLLVGFDDERKEIVMGIIDYIQTYTNLKKLETVIKSVGKVLPTVIDPQSYMDRFRAKMDMYFHCLPDQWHDFNVGLLARQNDCA